MKIIKRAAGALALGLVFHAAAIPAAHAEDPRNIGARIDFFVKETKADPAFVIGIVGHINKEMTDKFISDLEERTKQDPTKTITVWIDSQGGWVAEGRRIMAALKAAPNPVNMVCGGNAQSMAAIIYIDRPKKGGINYALDDCKLMTHAAYSQYAYGKTRNYLENKDLVSDRYDFVAIIERAAKTSRKQALLFVTTKDKYITLEHAQRIFFVDKVIKYTPQP